MPYPLNSRWLNHAYNEYMSYLREKWEYTNDWRVKLPRLILWYAVAGQARGSEGMADRFLRDLKAGTAIIRNRQHLYEEAQILVERISVQSESNAISWILREPQSIRSVWKDLDDLPGIGPKIASFIMRDLSFFRDLTDDSSGSEIAFNSERDSRWFDGLELTDQAIFFPIDKHVHEEARRQDASQIANQHEVSGVQADCQLYLREAKEVVTWSRQNGFDPRLVNIYWYMKGSEWI